MAPPLVPQLLYRHRPATRLLLGAVVGMLLYQSGCLLWGSIGVGVVALILFLLNRSWGEVVLWIALFGISFGWYSQLRSKDFALPNSTLYDTHLRILHPIISSAESPIRYRAEVLNTSRYEGKAWITILLALPTDTLLTESRRYGSQAIATLDITSLSSLSRGKNGDSYQKYLMSEGIEMIGTLQHIKEIEPMTRPPLFSLLQKWRSQLKQRFEAIAQPYIPWEHRGLIYALTLGDRSLLPSSMRQEFAQAGVAHILALSGYHLGVVLWLVGSLITRLLWRYKWRRHRYLFIFLIILSYTLFSGASTATVRAFVMSSLLLGAKFLGRPTDPIQTLSLVAVFFLVPNPFAYYSVGLLLSIGAVWGIYSFFHLFRRLFTPSNRILIWLRDVLAITISAQIGVLPLLLNFFGFAPLTFLWSNIPLVFISSILIPAALISFIAMLILGSLPSILLQGLNFLATSMEAVTNLFSTDPFAIELQVDWIATLLYYAIAYLTYRLLHSYTCRVEAAKLVNKNRHHN